MRAASVFFSDNQKTVLAASIAEAKRRILATAMTRQDSYPRCTKSPEFDSRSAEPSAYLRGLCVIRVLFLLTLTGLLGLCATNAAAQMPEHEPSAALMVKRPRLAVPVVQQGLTAPVYNDPAAALRSAKFIYVRSTSLLVGVPVIEAKLQKRSEFAQLCLAITRDYDEADLILVVEHDLFTKYVYTAIHKDTNIVVASGKLSSLGGTVAGKVAKRFMKQVMKARGSAPRCTS